MAEKILEKLPAIKCKYAGEGCSYARVDAGALTEHEDGCHYRTIACPVCKDQAPVALGQVVDQLTKGHPDMRVMKWPGSFGQPKIYHRSLFHK